MENTSNSQPNVSEICTSTLCVSQVGVVCLIAVVSLAGNMWILAILLSTPTLRNCHGYLLTSLAVADFGIGLIAATAVYPTVTHTWPYGDAACQITAFWEGVFIIASSLTLMLLSIERYIAVAHPFKYKRLVTKRNTAISIAIVCWVFPIMFYTSFILVRSQHQFTEQVRVCTPAYGDGFAYTIVGLFCFYVPCLVIVGITSVVVHRTLSQNAQQRQSMLASAMTLSPSPPLPQPSSPPSPPTSSSPLPPRLSRQEVKMFRLVVVVALAFYVCWVPYVTVGLSYTAAGQTAPSTLVFFIYWLHMCSGLCNFVIYFVMNTAFREAISEKAKMSCLLCCRIKKRGHSYNLNPKSL